MSIVRENLMEDKYYTPYCGNVSCSKMPRTQWGGYQFNCPHCGWKSNFTADFILKYKEKWNK